MQSYEAPGTAWLLTIRYATKTPVQFPGESFPGHAHQEQWRWLVDADLPRLISLLDLFHEVPFGKDEAPLISREEMYPVLRQKLLDVSDLLEQEKLMEGGNLLLLEFELEVADLCVGASPSRPWPNGPDTGIANTDENPACCKLIVDAEYVGTKLGIIVGER